MKKLCYVATIPAAVHAFLRAHIQKAAVKYDVTVICNSTDEHLLEGLDSRIYILPIERKPSVWQDIVVLYQLIKFFRKEQFDIVHSIIPKSGLLAMLAAWIARVPVRIHTFTGQVWVTQHGVKRFLLKWFDKLIVFFSNCILTDSISQREFLVKEGVVSPGTVKVIGAGSICGVDPLRFHPDKEIRQAVRNELGIPQYSKLILFVGRLNEDKGMLDLAVAFNAIAKTNSDISLLLVGSEENVPFSRIRKICVNELDRLHYVNFTSTPERYMMAADIFCLPSYREGMPMTIIEAAACDVPTVASRIYGITDAIVDGETGLLFHAGDVEALTQNLLRLITENKLRKKMGAAARLRALVMFSSEKIASGMLKLYDSLS